MGTVVVMVHRLRDRVPLPRSLTAGRVRAGPQDRVNAGCGGPDLSTSVAQMLMNAIPMDSLTALAQERRDRLRAEADGARLARSARPEHRGFPPLRTIWELLGPPDRDRGGTDPH